MTKTRTSRFIATLNLLLLFLVNGIALAQAPSKPKVEQSWKNLLDSEAKTIQLKMAASEEHIAELETRLKEKQSEVQAANVSEIAFDDVFRMLHLQNAELSIDLRGLNARLNLLKEQVEKKMANEKDMASIEIEAAKKQVALTQKRLETTRRLQAKGARSNDELFTAEHEAEVAKLQLRLAMRRIEQNSSSITEAVFETALEIAEKKARLEAVTKMLTSHREARSAVSKGSDLKLEIAREKLTLGALKTELRDIELQLSRSESQRSKY